jgi:hypothetical protein
MKKEACRHRPILTPKQIEVLKKVRKPQLKADIGEAFVKSNLIIVQEDRTYFPPREGD